MTLQFGTVEQLTQMNGVKIVVFGQPKIGKTTLIGTCPRPFIISAERGLLSLRNNPETRNIMGVEIRSLAQFQEAERWCMESVEARQFDTFCLDSITELMEVCLVEEKQKARDEAIKAKKKVDGFAPYNELGSEGMRILRRFRDEAHKHVYFIAQQEREKDEFGAVINMPSMPGKQLTRSMPYLFDCILQLTRQQAPDGTPYNALKTQPDAHSYAGDRSGKLDYWEQPNITSIINKILG